jgi:cutinase
MSPITGRVGAVGLVVAGAVLSSTLGVGVASADQCPDVQVIFARGTNEPVGLGFTGQIFANALTAKLPGKAVAVSPVNYPASDDYVRSAAVGADDDRAQIQSTVANCPDTDLVLGGYSQGAAVTELATSELPPKVVDHVAAVVLFGKPASEFSKMLAGGAALPTTGPLYVAKTLDLCIADDPICSPGSNVIAHMSYITSGMTEQAATFAAGKIDQRP